MSEVKNYSEDWQKVLIGYMLSDAESYARSQNIIQPDYFATKLRPVVRFIKSYSDQYKSLPTVAQIQGMTGTTISADFEPKHANWYLSEIEQFCRHRALENIIVNRGLSLLDEGRYGEIEQQIKNAMLISLQRDLGTDYFDDPRGRLTNMRERSDLISTGWQVLDEKLYGGFGRGTLNIFLGNSNAGKSLFLQNLALNYVLAGYNVLYYTLELSEDLVSLRMDAMLSGIPTKEIFRKLEEVDLKVRMQGKNAGSLKIKKLPESGTTTNSLHAHLKEYQIQTDLRVDVIIVDYLDLMHPNNNRIDPSDLFVKDKYVSEELRALADEWNAILISASQMNRSSVQQEEFNHSHVAGGISKINTADNVFAIFISLTMRERGEYQLQFLKTRTSAAVGHKIELKFLVESMRILDPDPEDVTKPKDQSQIAQDLQKIGGTSVRNGIEDMLKRMQQLEE